MPKNKSDGAETLWEDAVSCSRLIEGDDTFREEVLKELLDQGTIARLSKHDVQARELVKLLYAIPLILEEPSSDGFSYLSSADEKEVRDHAAKLVGASKKLMNLINAKSRIRSTVRTYDAFGKLLDPRCTFTSQMPLGAGLRHRDMHDRLMLYVRKIEEWSAQIDARNELISTADDAERLMKRFPKRNKQVALIVVAVENHLGKGHDPLVVDLMNTKAFKKLTGSSREITLDTIKTMRKSMRAMSGAQNAKRGSRQKT